MINFHDMFGGGGQLQVPVEKLDLFIDRVLAEKDETLYSMAQALQYKLQQAPMISVAESQIYPLVLNRIAQRLQQ
jgi:DNA-binding PadR family transcriptional regulator